MSSWDDIDAYLTRGPEDAPLGYVYEGPEKGYVPRTPRPDDAPTQPGTAPTQPGTPQGQGQGNGGKGGKPKQGQGTAANGLALARAARAPLDRLGDRVAAAPMPGGIGGPLAALALLTLAIVPVQTIDGKGASRLQLLWLVLSGSVSLEGSGGGSSGDIQLPGGATIPPAQLLPLPVLGDAQPNGTNGGGATFAELSAAGISIGAGQYRGLPAF